MSSPSTPLDKPAASTVCAVLAGTGRVLRLLFAALLIGSPILRLLMPESVVFWASSEPAGFLIIGSTTQTVLREYLFPYSLAISLAAGMFLLGGMPWGRAGRLPQFLCIALFLITSVGIYFLQTRLDATLTSPLMSLLGGLLAASALRALQLYLHIERTRDTLTRAIGNTALSLDEATQTVEQRFSSLNKTQELAQTQMRETAAQDERNRLARDLHDTIKQQLFAINMAAATAQTLAPHDLSGTMEMVQEVRNLSQQAQVEMKALLTQLRPQPLAAVGLRQALQDQLEALHFRSEVAVELNGELPMESERLPPGAQEAIFRVAQEALSNIARHARAARTSVELSHDDSHFIMHVRDDGQGFIPGTANTGMGLGNMRTRIAEIGGSMAVESAPGAGTLLTISVPLVATSSKLSARNRHMLLDRWTTSMWLNSFSYIGIILIVSSVIGFIIGMIMGMEPRDTPPPDLSGIQSPLSLLILAGVILAFTSIPVATLVLQVLTRVRRHRLGKIAERFLDWGAHYKNLRNIDDYWYVISIAIMLGAFAWLGRFALGPQATLVLGMIAGLSLVCTLWAGLRLARQGQALMRGAPGWATAPWLRTRLWEGFCGVVFVITYVITSLRSTSLWTALASSDALESITASITLISVASSAVLMGLTSIACLRMLRRIEGTADDIPVGRRFKLTRPDQVYVPIMLLVHAIGVIIAVTLPPDNPVISLWSFASALLYVITFGATRSLTQLDNTLPEAGKPAGTAAAPTSTS
jgi:signal transduction histidine kinase